MPDSEPAAGTTSKADAARVARLAQSTVKTRGTEKTRQAATLVATVDRLTEDMGQKDFEQCGDDMHRHRLGKTQKHVRSISCHAHT